MTHEAQELAQTCLNVLTEELCLGLEIAGKVEICLKVALKDIAT